MLREVLHSKLHMAAVTTARPDYVGSITIDEDLLDAVGMRVNDRVLISNCRNGARLETYIFAGARGSKVIELNGAAAHLVEVTDRVIIMHYCQVDDEGYRTLHPKVAILNERNEIVDRVTYHPSDVSS